MPRPLEEEILAPPPGRKLVLFAAIGSLLAAVVFMILAARYNQSPFLLQQPVARVIPLKLSQDDLLALNENMNTNQWIGVRWIEGKEQQRKIKIRHMMDSSFDFQMLINDTVFNLFEFTNERKKLYDLYLKAGSWGIESAPLQLIQLKINEVPVGVYLMEQQVYQQIRDDKGNYFISLGTDTLWMREFHYFTSHRETERLYRYFDLMPLARFLVFFSLFSFQEPIDLRFALFRYDAGMEKFQPYLSMESVVHGMKTRDLKFDIRVINNWRQYAVLTPRMIEDLLQRAGSYSYPRLLEIILREALERLERKAVV